MAARWWRVLLVVVGLILCVLLWIEWQAAAPPSIAEINAAFASSNEESVMIRGWKVIGGPRPPGGEITTDDDFEGPLVEAYIFEPVSPMAKARAFLGLLPLTP